MKFAEFKDGMLIKAGPVIVTEAEILEFARKFDPQWFHTDPKRAAEGRWGGLIASGWHTCALAMRMAVDAALHDSESFGSPGLGEVRWRVPVRPGDQLRLDARVQGVRKSSSRPTWASSPGPGRCSTSTTKPCWSWTRPACSTCPATPESGAGRR